MPEFTDTLSEYIARIENAEEKYKTAMRAEIITSEDLRIEPLSSAPIKREQIAWRLWEYNMTYIVTADPETEVERHRHDEDIFRLIIKGSLIVNDREMREGMWFVVRANVPYKIYTERGYTALVRYRNACMPVRC